MDDPPRQIDLIFEALEFAAERHRGQRRKDQGESPYINHPIQVAAILAAEAEQADEETLAAALLHDTLEDTSATPEAIEAKFGARVLQIVKEVTDDKSLPRELRKSRQIETAAALSFEARLVRLADKIANIRDLVDYPPIEWSPGRRLAYLQWSGEVVEGLRGTDPQLEAHFDEAYTEVEANLDGVSGDGSQEMSS